MNRAPANAGSAAQGVHNTGKVVNPSDSASDSQSQDAKIILALLRVGSLRLKLAAAGLDEIGVSLQRGMITDDEALRWIASSGATEFCRVEQLDLQANSGAT